MIWHNDKNWKAARAYFEDRLSTEERSEFEARLLEDPDLMEALEELQYAKMLLGKATTKNREKTAGQQGRGVRKWFIGAGIATALVAALVYTTFVSELSNQNPAEIHREFASQKITVQSIEKLEDVVGSSKLFPDLNSVNLLLVSKKKVKYGVAAHYSGRKNCRLTLIVGKNIPAPDDRQTQSTSWHQNGREYTLINEGMDPKRFELIAEHLRNIDKEAPAAELLVLQNSIKKTKSCHLG